MQSIPSGQNRQELRQVSSVDSTTRISPIDAVRLLRRDVVAAISAGSDGDDEQAFLLWWLLSGRREYPAAAMAMTEAQRQRCFEPLPDWPVKGGLGLNRLLRALFAYRPDLPLAFDLSSPVGYWDALAWFYVVGLRELGLETLLDSKTRAALAGPVVFEAAVDEQPSWLMVLLWRRQPALQQALDLNTPTGRAGLRSWFSRLGIEQFGLQALVSEPAPELVKRRRIAGQGNSKERTFGVNLIGFAFGELGIGEDLRMAALACEEAGVPFRVLNIDPGKHLRQADRLVGSHCTDDVADLPYSINLFCLTGFDTLRVYAEKGLDLFEGRHNIGWWPWELPVWPQRWKAAFTVVDEVWAATRFTQKMFREACDKPVTLMSLPVSVARLKKVTRQSLGLPTRRFLFLYVFDFNSYLARKNPHAVIEAFQKAFPAEDGSVGLVLKTMNSRADSEAWHQFVAVCAADPRILLLDRTLDREVVLGLVDACDAYVSLHRSEGFGRTLAEAMLLGKPVVGTDFSGNTDFLTSETGYPVKWTKRTVAVGEYPFIEAEDGAWWAEPDLAHAASQLREAYGAAGSPWALQLPQQIGEQFSAKAIGLRMHALLRRRFNSLKAVAR